MIELLVAAATAAASPVTFSCDPAPQDCSGWYRSPVRLTWAVPAEYDTEGCDNRTYTADTTGTANHCRATNGTVTYDLTVTIRLDATPPVLAGAAPTRPPDHDGWYTSPVEVRWAGTDATSGIAGCDDLAFVGAPLLGTCTDVAGNTAPPLAFEAMYDATPPTVSVSRSVGDRRVALRWTVSPDTVQVTVARGDRTLHTGGTQFTDTRVANGTRYTYRVTAVDAAGNAASADIAATPGRRLLAPARKAVVGRRPVLRWTPVRGARYYNVQLFRHGHKVLSRWPRTARYHTPRLARGTYTWYVWPGRGPRRANRYGKLIGRRTFTVVADTTGAR